MKPLIPLILLAFVTNTLGIFPVYAQDYRLPPPGVMVHLSPPLDPPILRGIKVYPKDPFRFDFILDKGDDSNRHPERSEGSQQEQLKSEATNLIKYFLASLTIPEKDLWVNLSPYEKNRIIPKSFGLTEMGRDLLAEDYMLKQITASLIYPEDIVGRKFWKRVYEQAAKKFGTTNIPVNTFNKVWIVPEKAVVFENAKAGTAYVVESKLKVMLEQDYLSLEKHSNALPLASRNDINSVGANIVREIVIPELTKEVNEDKNFAKLRQVYNSLILATWYKKKIKESILSKVYADKSKVAGVNIDDPREKERIYQKYLRAFKKGVFNYIKEDIDPSTQESTPRKYFSGGVVFDINEATYVNPNGVLNLVKSMPAQAMITSDQAVLVRERTVSASDQENKVRGARRNSQRVNNALITKADIGRFMGNLMPSSLLGYRMVNSVAYGAELSAYYGKWGAAVPMVVAGLDLLKLYTGELSVILESAIGGMTLTVLSGGDLNSFLINFSIFGIIGVVKAAAKKTTGVNLDFFSNATAKAVAWALNAALGEDLSKIVKDQKQRNYLIKNIEEVLKNHSSKTQRKQRIISILRRYLQLRMETDINKVAQDFVNKVENYAQLAQENKVHSVDHAMSGQIVKIFPILKSIAQPYEGYGGVAPLGIGSIPREMPMVEVVKEGLKIPGTDTIIPNSETLADKLRANKVQYLMGDYLSDGEFLSKLYQQPQTNLVNFLTHNGVYSIDVPQVGDGKLEPFRSEAETLTDRLLQGKYPQVKKIVIAIVAKYLSMGFSDDFVYQSLVELRSAEQSNKSGERFVYRLIITMARWDKLTSQILEETGHDSNVLGYFRRFDVLNRIFHTSQEAIDYALDQLLEIRRQLQISPANTALFFELGLEYALENNRFQPYEHDNFRSVIAENCEIILSNLTQNEAWIELLGLMTQKTITLKGIVYTIENIKPFDEGKLSGDRVGKNTIFRLNLLESQGQAKLYLVKQVDQQEAKFDRIGTGVSGILNMPTYTVEFDDSKQKVLEKVEYIQNRSIYSSNAESPLKPLLEADQDERYARLKSFGYVIAAEYILGADDCWIRHIPYRQDNQRFSRIDWEHLFNFQSATYPVLRQDELRFLMTLLTQVDGRILVGKVMEGFFEKIEEAKVKRENIWDVIAKDIPPERAAEIRQVFDRNLDRTQEQVFNAIGHPHVLSEFFNFAMLGEKGNNVLNANHAMSGIQLSNTGWAAAKQIIMVHMLGSMKSPQGVKELSELSEQFKDRKRVALINRGTVYEPLRFMNVGEKGDEKEESWDLRDSYHGEFISEDTGDAVFVGGALIGCLGEAVADYSKVVFNRGGKKATVYLLASYVWNDPNVPDQRTLEELLRPFDNDKEDHKVELAGHQFNKIELLRRVFGVDPQFGRTNYLSEEDFKNISTITVKVDGQEITVYKGAEVGRELEINIIRANDPQLQNPTMPLKISRLNKGKDQEVVNRQLIERLNQDLDGLKDISAVEKVEMRSYFMPFRTWARFYKFGFLFAKRLGFSDLMAYFGGKLLHQEHPAINNEYDEINRLNRATDGVIYYPGIGTDTTPIFKIKGMNTLVGVDPLEGKDAQEVNLAYEMEIIAQGGKNIEINHTIVENIEKFEFKFLSQGVPKTIVLYRSDAVQNGPSSLKETDKGYDIFLPKAAANIPFDEQSITKACQRIKPGGLFLNTDPKLEEVLERNHFNRVPLSLSVDGLSSLWIKEQKQVSKAMSVDLSEIKQVGERNTFIAIMNDQDFINKSVKQIFPNTKDNVITNCIGRVHPTRGGGKEIFEAVVTFQNGVKRTLIFIVTRDNLPLEAEHRASHYEEISNLDPHHRFTCAFGAATKLAGLSRAYVISQGHAGVSLNRVTDILEGLTGKAYNAPDLYSMSEVSLREKLKWLQENGFFSLHGGPQIHEIGDAINNRSLLSQELEGLLLYLDGRAVAFYIDFFKETHYFHRDPNRGNIGIQVVNHEPVFKLMDYDDVNRAESGYELLEAFNSIFARTEQERQWAEMQRPWNIIPAEFLGLVRKVYNGLGLIDQIEGDPKTPGFIKDEIQKTKEPVESSGLISMSGLYLRNFIKSTEPYHVAINTNEGANGGIDLSVANGILQTRNAGEGIKFHLNPDMLAKLRNAPGFVPVIINIQPMTDLRLFLGLKEQKDSYVAA